MRKRAKGQLGTHTKKFHSQPNGLEVSNPQTENETLISNVMLWFKPHIDELKIKKDRGEVTEIPLIDKESIDLSDFDGSDDQLYQR